MEGLPLSTRELGLPEKFQNWRPSQVRCINRCLNQDRRYQIHAIPTGGGKSLAYVANALITGERTLILTSTKALQDQLAADFGSIGLADLRGRQNYKCRMSPNMTCEEGKHAGCPDSKETSCPHRCALEIAKRSQIVVTNYACWISNQLFGENLGKFDALVLDEAHNAPDEVCGLIGVELTTEEVYQLLDSEFPEREEASEWKNWAQSLLARAELEKTALAQLIERSGSARVTVVNELRRWSGLCRKLALVAGMTGPWCVEPTRRGFRLDPLWPSQYAARALFAGIPKIYGYSATVAPKTMYIMGVRPDELESYQYASSFPARRSPVYRIPTCRVDRHMDAGAKALWVGRIDQILARRGDRKGIIHSVSYQRREDIMRASAYRSWMVGHSPEDTASTIEWFKASKPPLVLVSPAVTTGYDFPGSACEFSIIGKIPFPDTRSKVMQARAKSDPLYVVHLAVQALEQATGRAMRYPTDQNESFIVDDHIARLLAAHRDLFLDWWLKLYRRRELIPDPPPALNGTGGID